MIDTIEFKLNNVKSYPLIKTQFERTSKIGTTSIVVDEDTGEVFENSKVRALLHHDTGNIMSLTKRSSIYIASSHYSLSYVYNIAQDFISFNFAIPKYLYGTNVLQFIRYYSQSPDTVYQHLLDFVKGFVKKHFIQEVKLRDIELTRLDFCYNQFFNSKNDAITYLTEQKELLKKHARSTKNDYRNYETSLLYVTKRYSFKIYHKGTEFKKHDKKQLIKKNPTGETLDTLQDISDRILRYEVTFRKAQMDYLFEQNELHNKYLPYIFNQQNHQYVRQFNPALYADGMRFVEQSKHFTFEQMHVAEHVEAQTVFFDFDVFKAMYDFFWQKVKDYQLRQKLSVHDVLKKVDTLNEQRDNVRSENKKLRRELSYNKPMIATLALLTNYYSLDELRKSGLLPKSTYYHYMKKLKEVGIDSESRLSDMPPPALDYVDYKYYFGRYHLK